MKNYKEYRIEAVDGEIIAEGYGSLNGAKEDAKLLSKEFGERLVVFDEENELYNF